MLRPTATPGSLALLVTLTASLLAAAGCDAAPDARTSTPTVTTTASPQPPEDLPALPVGRSAIGAPGQVKVDGSRIRAGRRTVDLAPLRIDGWVAVAGGLYFLNQGELWFTDLRRAVPTAYKEVTALELDDGRSTLSFVTHGHGARDADGERIPLRVRYDVRTGTPLDAAYLDD